MTDNEMDELENGIESDHDLIILLKNKIDDLTTEVKETEEHLESSLNAHTETSHQLALHEKVSAQHQLLRHIFYGVILLVTMMGALVLVGWATGQTSVEREMAFFERIILVFIGIVGGAVSSFFDVRNFTLNNGNGGSLPAKKKTVQDTE